MVKIFEIEEQTLKLLRKYSWIGFPIILSSGYEKELDMSYLVLNQYDTNLDAFLVKNKFILQKSTIINIGLQLVRVQTSRNQSPYRLIDLKSCIV